MPEQIIRGTVDNVAPNAGEEISVEVDYSTANPPDLTLTGLTVRLHYNSNELAFVEPLENLFPTALQNEGQTPVPEGTEIEGVPDDGDPRTDTAIAVRWLDPNGAWPGEALGTPLSLLFANFTVLGDAGEEGVIINFTGDAGRDIATDTPYSLLFQPQNLSLQVDSAPLPTVDLSIASQQLLENGDTTQVTATLSNPANQDVTVALGFSNNLDEDFVVSAEAIEIPAGETTGSITLTALDNPDDDGDRALSVEITEVTNAIEGDQQQVSATVVDEERSQLIQVSADNVTPAVDEQITLAVNYSPLSPPDLSLTGLTLRVHYNAEELEFLGPLEELFPTALQSANPTPIAENSQGVPDDGDPSTDTAIEVEWFDEAGSWPGEGSDIPLTLFLANFRVLDDLGEAGAPINFTGDPGTDLSTNTESELIFQPPALSLQIGADLPTVTLTIDSQQLIEGGDPVTVTATLSEAIDQDVTIALGFSDNLDESFTASAEEIIIAEGDTTSSITLTPLDNAEIDGNRPLSVEIINVTNAVEGGQQQVKATIVDDEAAPIVEDATFSLDENSPVGTAVGTVTASDPNNDAIAFAIADGNENGAFTIDPSTGEITVANPQALDFETTPSFNLSVEASDGQLTSTGTITINLNDINDPPNVEDVTVQVAPDSPVGTLVGTVAATDPDGDPLTFAIIEGNPDPDEDGTAAFAIDEQSGEITVADSDDLDFDATPSFDLAVEASDGELADLAIFSIVSEAANQAPIVEDAQFSIDENAPVGTQVGTLTASDPENEALNFAFASGNLDVDGDGTAAFAIDDDGRITVADSNDLNFEQQASFTLEVTVTDPQAASDSATVRVNVNETDLPANLQAGAGNTLFLDSDDSANLLHTLTGQTTEQVHEIGYFLVDENGEFQGSLPGESDFDLQAALQSGQRIFSTLRGEGDEVISDLLSGLARNTIVEPGVGIAYYLIENSTTDAVLAGEAGFDRVRLGSDSLNLDAVAEGQFNLSWQLDDGTVTLSAALSDADPPLGTGLQSAVEVIDLREQAEVTATLGLGGVRSAAAFDNLLGLYAIDDPNGSVDGIAPGEGGYAAAALARAVDNLILRGGEEENTSAQVLGSVTLAGGTLYAPFIIANGGDLSIEEFLAENPNNQAAEDPSDVVAYFPFLAANPDGADHLRLLADNTFGFEDLPGGGDQDFNDAIFQVQLA